MGLYRNHRVSWKHWNPGLDNDHMTLGEVLATMPAVAASDVPWIIRLFENPASPIALPGAITLERHDAVHVLLGRGLLSQDEAFVIGFTMGTDRGIRPLHRRIFRFVSSRLYRPPYRLFTDDLMAFDLGYNLGLEQPNRCIQDYPFEDSQDLPMHKIRRDIGVIVHRLHAVYRYERAVLPHTEASKRLDLDYQGVDPSVLTRNKRERAETAAGKPQK